MSPEDFEALQLLTQQDVARLIGKSVKTVERMRLATEPHGVIRPMSGWKRIGGSLMLPAPALAAWIEEAPDA